jgi:hypothetical protein
MVQISMFPAFETCTVPVDAPAACPMSPDAVEAKAMPRMQRHAERKTGNRLGKPSVRVVPFMDAPPDVMCAGTRARRICKVNLVRLLQKMPLMHRNFCPEHWRLTLL